MTISAGHNTPRDVFLYLLAIITLVVSAVSLGIVIFQYINIYIPDIISDPYSSQSSYLNTMRYALATLMIVFSVFVWVSWFLRKDIIKFPDKRELKIRRWLLYLTLFVTALVIIGDLVTLLSSFLSGELSQRFILKVLSILFIAGSVFLHYLSELKDQSKEYKWIRLFDWVIVVAVLVTIVAGFFVAGSPANQRLVRADEIRVGDLQNIQWQIINYWQRKKSLPTALNDLSDPISGFIIPRDSDPELSYEYNVLGGLKFELCATFSTTSLEGNTHGQTKPVAVPIGVDGRPGYLSDVWWHGPGRVCFERTIDPDLYPPFDGTKPRPL